MRSRVGLPRWAMRVLAGIVCFTASSRAEDTHLPPAQPPFGWKLINCLGFYLQVPANVRHYRVQGIDSVGGYVRGGGVNVFYHRQLAFGLAGGPAGPMMPMSGAYDCIDDTTNWSVGELSVSRFTWRHRGRIGDAWVSSACLVGALPSSGGPARFNVTADCPDAAALALANRILGSFRPGHAPIQDSPIDGALWIPASLTNGLSLLAPRELKYLPVANQTWPNLTYLGVRLDVHCQISLEADRPLGSEPGLAAKPGATFTNVVVDGLPGRRFERPATEYERQSAKAHVLGLAVPHLRGQRNRTALVWVACKELADYPLAEAVLDSVLIRGELRPETLAGDAGLGGDKSPP